jgi:hypothetical protein
VFGLSSLVDKKFAKAPKFGGENVVTGAVWSTFLKRIGF